MKECKHKFKARYDKEWSTCLRDIIISGRNVKRVKNGDEPYLQKETYIYDICVKCGKIVKKE